MHKTESELVRRRGLGRVLSAEPEGMISGLAMTSYIERLQPSESPFWVEEHLGARRFRIKRQWL